MTCEISGGSPLFPVTARRSLFDRAPGVIQRHGTGHPLSSAQDPWQRRGLAGLVLGAIVSGEQHGRKRYDRPQRLTRPTLAVWTTRRCGKRLDHYM